MKVLFVLVVIAWIAVNIITSKMYSAKQLRNMVYSGCCVVGKICASLFYAPAWVLKGIRVVVLATIK